MERWILPSQLPFAASIDQNMEVLFQQSKYLLKTQFRRLTIMVCIHTDDPQQSSFLPLGLK